MSDTSHKHVRNARDRLIDMLGFGKTYPLRDLDVKDERLTVPFNAAAKIPIEISQTDVLYSLYSRDDQPVNRSAGVPVESRGNEETLILETPAIAEDVTYKIRTAKFEPERTTYLHQTATVKVGLDVFLKAEILDAGLLDPTIESPTYTDPRIVDYGDAVNVEIKDSQEGVDYQLVAFEKKNGDQEPEEVTLSEEQVRGNRGDIILRSQPVFEDTDIRIRAFKTFDPEEGRENQTDLLEVVLPLAVRANPANTVAVAPADIIDYQQSAFVKIAGTQQSVVYRVYRRVIPDREVIHREVPDADVVKISVPDEPDVQIRKPTLPSVWQELEGYLPVGDSKSGNGGEIQLQLDALTDDSLIIVQARKEHRALLDGQDVPKIPSAVPLQQPLVFLVRPDPAPGIRLKVPVDGAGTGGSIQVFNGQPGVFYYLNDSKDGKVIGLPAYFHKRDDRDDQLNKGLGQLKLEVDFVPATDPRRSDADESPDPAQIAPEPPLLETARLSLDATLEFEAVKAQTRVAKPLDHSAQIPAGPEVVPEKPVVDYGAKTRIRIIASRASERYQLMLDGGPLGEAIKGTGNNRLLDTGELMHDTTFELLITRPDDPIIVERILPVTILVRPDPTLAVDALESNVGPNAGTRIRIAASQPGVQYQLLIGETASGDAVAGSGDTIELPTGPLTADTTFIVRAAKIANTDINIQLNQQVQIKINPAAESPLPEPV